MTEPLCRNCRWWGTEPSWSYAMNDSPESKYHPCLFRADQDQTYPPDGTSDGERYDVIQTGPDFGCIHWRAVDGLIVSTTGRENEPLPSGFIDRDAVKRYAQGEEQFLP